MRTRIPLLLSVLTTGVLYPLSPYADALPSGGSVVSGSAVINQSGASQLDITQASSSAIINWQSFSVGQNSVVNISQPSSSSTLLNRVTGSTSSTIAGQINANGQVYLVNPNGIFISATGQINAAAFVASTLDITNDNFNAGKYIFNGTGASAQVLNQGTLTALEGGYLALIGGTVSNEGSLIVPLGKVAMASGERVTLDPFGDGFLQVAVPTAATGSSALVSNSGTISAKGGLVVLSAATATDMARKAVNMSGLIEAKSVSGHEGLIILAGGEGGDVDLSGSLDVSSSDTAGGSITITGRNIALSGATVNASGATGGGTVKIGGDKQGSGTLQRAKSVKIDAQTKIRADATQSGNGGTVVVWSDGTTVAKGTITAKGAGQGYSGGYVETSGASVDFTNIVVDTTSELGSAGLWLIDPTDLIVDATAAATIGSNLATTSVTLQTNSDGSTSGTGTTASGDGDIIINGAISWSAATTLKLSAYKGITVNAPITVNGNGSLSLTYSTTDLTNLSFGSGGSIIFAGAGTYTSQTLSINGTSYTLIYTMAQLDAIDGNLATATSGTSTVYGSGVTGAYALASDLDASGTTYVRSLVNIGTTYFTGTFEGLGNTISNLTLTTGTTQTYVGMFSSLGTSSVVRDLILENETLTSTGTNSAVYIGNLVGNVVGASIVNVSASGSLTYNNINTGTSSINAYIGGLVGNVASGTSLIQNSSTNITISAGYSTGSEPVSGLVGGLVGRISAVTDIKDSSASGSVTVTLKNATQYIGGLIGNINTTGGTISNSFATGNVSYSGATNASVYIGGLAGWNRSTVSDSYASGTVTLTYLGTTTAVAMYAGGLVGQMDYGSVADSSATGDVTVSDASATGTISTYVGGFIGSTGQAITTSYATGDVTVNAKGSIAYVGGFAGILGAALTGSGSTYSYATGDVIFTGAATTVALGGLVGNASTTTSTITEVYASGDVTYSYIGTAATTVNIGGLVGKLTQVLAGSSSYYSYATGNVSVYANAATVYEGGLVGYLGSSSTSSISQTYATGTTSYIHSGTSAAAIYVGGLVGYADIQNLTTPITLSYAMGGVSASIESGSSGAVTGTVGGLIGYIKATNATTSTNTVTYSFATGSVYDSITTGTQYVGGLVGQSYGANLAYVYSTGSVTMIGTSGYAAGLVGYGRGYSTTNMLLKYAYAANKVVGGGTVDPVANYNVTATNVYWDTTVSGLTTSTMAATGYTTAQLQSNYNSYMTNLTSVFGGGTNGIYPYLTAIFANGVKMVTGVVYSDNGVTLVNDGTVYLVINGVSYGSTLTSSNGTYYFVVSADAISSSGSQVAVYTTADATSGTKTATTVSAGATGTLTSFNVYGGWLYESAASTISTLSALNSAYATAVGATAAASMTFSSRNITINASSFVIDSVISTSGTLVLVSSGTVTQSAAINAGTLLLSGSGTFTLTNTSNVVSLLAADVGTLSFTDSSGLTIGSGKIGGGTVITGVETDNVVTLVTSGNLTIASAATIRGKDPVLAAGGAFINNAGSAAVTATSGRWLIYSANPSGDTFGSLNSSNTAIWNSTYSSLAPSSISLTGNRYIFGNQLSLTVTLANATKVYGNDGAATVASAYTVSGYNTGVTGVYLGDGTISVADILTLTSTGSAATAGVGTYAITASVSGSVSASGYTVTVSGSGTLTVTARALTVTADNLSRIYGDANPTLTYTAVGLVNGDTVSGALTTTAATSSNVGAYAITQGTLAASDNYSLTFTSGTLTVTARNVAVTADSLSRIYGDANPTLTYTATGLLSGDTLSGALATTGTTSSNVGSYAITQGTLTASSNYSIAFTDGTLTVTARSVTVTADSLSRIYGDSNPTLTYTATGLLNGDTLSGALATTATTTSNVGTYTITQGTLGAAGNYTISSFTSGVLTITTRAISVTADSLNRIYGDTNPTLTYTVGGSGLANGETLSGALATSATTTSNIGNYAITQGTLSANSNYSLTFTAGTLTITARNVAVTADSLSRVYGDANPTLTYTAAGLVNGDTLSGALTTSATTTSNVGTYEILQGTLAYGGNYTLTFTSGALTVTARAVTVTADSLSRIYGDANPTLTYTAAGLINGDIVSGALATAATTTSNVGAYAITQGTLAVTSNYSIVFTNGTLTVTARPVTVTADSLSRIYGDANPTLTYTVSGLLNNDSLSGELSTSASVSSSIGSYAITQGTLAAAGNYTISSFTSGVLTITARALSITADSLSRVYGDANPTLTYTTSGLVNGDALSGALTTAATTTSNVGSYAITQGTLAASSNYNLTFTSGSLTVTARNVAVTADSLSRIYGDANPTLTYTATGLVNGDALSGALATTATAASNVGSYEITQGTIAASNNYSLTFTSGTLTVTARNVAVTADSLSRIYGDANPTLTYTATGLVNGDTLSGSLTTAATTTSTVGSYAITQGSLTLSSNYNIAFTNGTLTVTSRPLTVTADSLSRIYGDANPTLTYTTGGGGLVNGDSLTGALTTTATTASNIGAYTITQGTLTTSSNYAITFVNGTLTVTARPITVTADSLSRLYGDANPTLTYVVGGSGLANNDTLSGGLTTTATTTSNVGIYAITQGTLAASNNYSLTFTSGTLMVTVRNVAVTADSLSRIYGDTNPTLTYTATGLVNGDSLGGSITTAATTTSNVGTYAITQGTLAASSNYSLTFTSGTLTVTARNVAVTADSLSRIYGNANPTLTYTATGLVNGDSLSGSITTAATTTSNVGAYAITQGTLAATSNYNLTFTSGTLTVTARNVAVTADSLSRVYGDANPTLTYTATGLVNGDSLSGTLATAAMATSNVGTYAISQGTLAASSNYNLTFTSGTLTVTARNVAVTANSLSRVYGDANPTLTYTIGGSGLANGDTLSGALATAATTTSNVGTYAITQGTLAASSNYNLTFTSGTMTVTARNVAVTADSLSRIYGNANPTLTYTATGLVNGDALTGALTTTATTASNVGGYAITQGTLVASSNYALTFTSGTLTVTARNVAITANSLGRVYGDANPTLTYTATGLVNGDSLSGNITTTATTTSNVGAYAITQGTLTASSNYSTTFTAGSLTVTARTLSITANSLSKIYGDANPTLTYTTTGLVNGDTLSGSLTTAATATSSVGAYGITRGTLAASSNYALTFTSGTLTVTARNVAVTANSLSRVYGDANPTLTYTATGLVNGNTLSGALATTATTAVNVGTYAIAQGTLAASSNYSLTFTGGTLTVTARPITITANSLSREYEVANPTLTYTVGGRGLVNGDSLSGAMATLATLDSAVGSYAITRGSLTASSNYVVTFVGGTLTVRASGSAEPVATTPSVQNPVVVHVLEFGKVASDVVYVDSSQTAANVGAAILPYGLMSLDVTLPETASTFSNISWQVPKEEKRRVP